MKTKDLKPQKKWFYPLIYGLIIAINFFPSITEKPYLPQDTQDVIINLLMVAVEPYRVFAPLFHIATLLIIFAIIWNPVKMGRIVAGYMGVNYIIIALVQTMGQTEKYGFVLQTSALATALFLGATWVIVAVRNDLRTILRKLTMLEYVFLSLAFIAFWGPYTVVNGYVQPDFNPLLLLASPDYGLTFCFTTPVFLLGLVLFYPHVNQFAYRVTAFSGLLYGLFNLTHWFSPERRWMGFLHLPLLLISIYALVLPGFSKTRKAVP